MITLFYTKIHSEFFIFLGVALHYTIHHIKKANRILSRKKKGSNHRRLAKIALARLYKKISNQRKDFHFKLANKICSEYA